MEKKLKDIFREGPKFDEEILRAAEKGNLIFF